MDRTVDINNLSKEQQTALLSRVQSMSDADRQTFVQHLEKGTQIPETYVKPVGQTLSPRTLREEPGVVAQAGNVAAKIGETFDKYTGAPTRAAIGAAQEGKPVSQIVQSFKTQFGADPKKAPTGKDIAVKAGVSTTPPSETNPLRFSEPGEKTKLRLPWGQTIDIPDPRPTKGGPLDITPAGAAGVVVDLAADPTNFVPVGKIARGAVKGVEVGAKIGSLPARIIAPGVVAAGEGAYKGIKQTAQALAKAINPRIAADFNAAVQIAEKHGINPETLTSAIKYGEGSTISILERVAAEGPAGEPARLRHQAGLNEIRKATDNYIEKQIGKGRVLRPEEAGQLIRDAYDEGVNRIFEDNAVTYASVGDRLEKPALIPAQRDAILGRIDQLAAETADRLQNRVRKSMNEGSQLKFTLDQLNKLRPTVQGGQWDYVLADMQSLGSASYKTQFDIGWDEKVGRELYDKLREGLIETARVYGGDKIVNELKESNETLSSFFRRNELIEGIVKDKQKPGEAVFRDIIESGNSKRIEALKYIVGEDTPEFAALKSTWIDSLKQLDKDQGFSFARLGGTLRNDNRARVVAQNLLRPEDLEGLGELISLGENYGPAILNFSGTERSRVFKNIPGALAQQATDAGMLEYLKSKAAKPGRGGGGGGGKSPLASRFSASPIAQAVPAAEAAPGAAGNLLNNIAQYGADLIPSNRQVLNKSLRTYSAERNNDSAINRRAKKVEKR